jgi:hypothetical protein
MGVDPRYNLIMRPISPRVKKILLADKFMETCCYTGSKEVSWEHCWIYAGRQIDEAWAIVGLRRDLNTSSMPKKIKEYCQWVSINRATEDDFKKYPKFDWLKQRDNLNKIYGVPARNKR